MLKLVHFAGYSVIWQSTSMYRVTTFHERVQKVYHEHFSVFYRMKLWWNTYFMKCPERNISQCILTFWNSHYIYKKRLTTYASHFYLSKARFPLGGKCRYLATFFRRYLTIILKTSVIRFTYIESEFWSSFDIMSDSEGKDILFLQLVVLFKMKKEKKKQMGTRIIS